MKLKWKYCQTCHKAYIECPKCGNNSCNAGFGRLYADGSVLKFPYPDNWEQITTTCDVCPQAYEIQEKGWKERKSPLFYRIREWIWWNININIIRRLDKCFYDALYAIRKGQKK